jgi:hypothetical protein
MAGFDTNLGGAAGKRYPTTDVYEEHCTPCRACLHAAGGQFPR